MACAAPPLLSSPPLSRYKRVQRRAVASWTGLQRGAQTTTHNKRRWHAVGDGCSRDSRRRRPHSATGKRRMQEPHATVETRTQQQVRLCTLRAIENGYKQRDQCGALVDTGDSSFQRGQGESNTRGYRCKGERRTHLHNAHATHGDHTSRKAQEWGRWCPRSSGKRPGAPGDTDRKLRHQRGSRAPRNAPATTGSG